MGVKVRQRGANWYVFVDYQYQKKAKKVGPGKAGFDAANELAAQWRAQIALGQFSFEREGKKVTFEDYAEKWLRTYVGGLKAGTQEKYAEILRVHWFPRLGHHSLSGISRAELKAVIEAKLKTHSRSTVTLMIDVVRGCLQAAVEDKIIETNPAARLGKLFPMRRALSKATIAPGIIALVLGELHRQRSTIYGPAFILSRAGLRLGEVLTLRVGDVDHERKGLIVRTTWGSRRRDLGDARYNTPKGNRERFVDLSQQAYAIVKAASNGRGNDQWLFPSRRGTAMHPTTFEKAWKKTFLALGLTPKTPHSLCHSYATMLLEQGENVAYVRDQLGHASVKTTVDIYSHLTPGTNHAAVDQLDGVYDIRNVFETTAKLRH
jgi:integrase